MGGSLQLCRRRRSEGPAAGASGEVATHALSLQGPGRGTVREGAGADRQEGGRPHRDQVRNRGPELCLPLPGALWAFRRGWGFLGRAGEGLVWWLPGEGGSGGQVSWPLGSRGEVRFCVWERIPWAEWQEDPCRGWRPAVFRGLRHSPCQLDRLHPRPGNLRDRRQALHWLPKAPEALTWPGLQGGRCGQRQGPGGGPPVPAPTPRQSAA